MKPINITELTPAMAIHPGEMIIDELEARSIKQQEFALQIGMQKSQLNEIIKGKRSINAEFALLVEAALGISAEFWLKAQMNYELDVVKIQRKIKLRTEAIIVWNRMKDKLPLSYFKSKRLLTGDPLIDLETIKRIYHITSIDELPKALNSSVMPDIPV
jgi:HTH-type transcriptional regulator / antitoxin HigA